MHASTNASSSASASSASASASAASGALRLRVTSLLQRPAPLRPTDRVAAACCPWTSTSGEQSLFVCDRGDVQRINGATNTIEKRQTVVGASACTMMAISPSGQRLYAVFDTLHENSPQRTLVNPNPKPDERPVFHPPDHDAKMLCVYDAETMALLLSKKGSEIAPALSCLHDLSPQHMRIIPSPNERTVAVIDVMHRLYLLDAEDSLRPVLTGWIGNHPKLFHEEHDESMPLPMNPVFVPGAYTCAFAARGDLFAVCSWSGVSGKSILRLLSIGGIHTNSDGNDDENNNAGERPVSPVVHREWVLPVKGDQEPSAICFSPCGSRLAVAGHMSVLVLCIHTGAVITEMQGHPAPIVGMVWTPIPSFPAAESPAPSWGRITTICGTRFRRAEAQTTLLTVWEQAKMDDGRAFSSVLQGRMYRGYGAITASADGRHVVLGAGRAPNDSQTVVVPVLRFSTAAEEEAAAAAASSEEKHPDDVHHDGADSSDSSNTSFGAAAAAARSIAEPAKPRKYNFSSCLPAELGGDGPAMAVAAAVPGRRGRGRGGHGRR